MPSKQHKIEAALRAASRALSESKAARQLANISYLQAGGMAIRLQTTLPPDAKWSEVRDRICREAGIDRRLLSRCMKVAQILAEEEGVSPAHEYEKWPTVVKKNSHRSINDILGDDEPT